MDLFCNDVYTFLNNLDEHLPHLLKQSTLDIFNSNVMSGINAMLLYANEYAILNRIAQFVIKKHFDVKELSIRQSMLGPKETDGTYLLSDVHMEFELNDKSLNFIKSIICNQTISKREYMFVIKNAESSINKNLFFELRRLIDMNPMSKFIITTVGISFMEKSLLSRMLPVSCCFPFQNVLNDIKISTELSHERLHALYMESKCNVVTFIQLLSCTSFQLLWHKHLDNLMMITFKKEKKLINIIAQTRDTVYKLYHIGVPLHEVCHYVILKLSKSEDSATMHKIVELSSLCQYECKSNNKEILSYEHLILGIYNILCKK
jgi:hypothetical protein